MTVNCRANFTRNNESTLEIDQVTLVLGCAGAGRLRSCSAPIGDEGDTMSAEIIVQSILPMAEFAQVLAQQLAHQALEALPDGAQVGWNDPGCMRTLYGCPAWG